MNKDNLVSLSVGIGVGILLGGVLGILYAPKNGEETRRLIKDKAEKVAGDVRAKINRATIRDIKGGV